MLDSPVFALAIGIGAAVTGTLGVVLGYRLFRVTTTVVGVLLGAALGGVGGFLLHSRFLPAFDLVQLAGSLALLAAVLGGLLGWRLYLGGLAVGGAALGAVAGLALMGFLGREDPPVVILSAVVGAIFAVVLKRPLIIVSTSFTGAWAAVTGGLVAWNRTLPLDVGAYVALLQSTLLYIVALGLLGVVVQHVTTRERRAYDPAYPDTPYAGPEPHRIDWHAERAPESDETGQRRE